MAPFGGHELLTLGSKASPAIPKLSTRTTTPIRADLTTDGAILEAWAQGYNVGSLIILILIVFCNYRSGVWLHKLILFELVLALWHGTFIFVKDPAYGWYISVTATLLFISYFLHNVVSWLKIRPFLPRWGSRVFVISLLCVQPFWIVEAWSNFSYWNSLGSDANLRIRPWEALARDPWWLFTTWKLISSIKKTYGFRLWELVRINPRFGVMLFCMILSIAFLLTDVGVSAARVTAYSGVNPYWRFALVFKSASDTIFLDDFKSVLDSIVARKFSSTSNHVHHGSITDSRGSSHKKSRSASRGEDFMQFSSFDDPSEMPVHSRTSSRPTTSRFKSFSLFSKERTAEIPSIQIQPEIVALSQARHSSDDISRRADPMLPRPVHTVYGNDNARAKDSDEHLMIGRLV